MADKYDELAKKFGGTDFDQLAVQFGGQDVQQPQGLGRQPAPQPLTGAEQAGRLLSGGILERALNAVAPYARGFVQGAADPIVGTTQIAANVIGQGGEVNRAITDKERQGEQLGTSGLARFIGNAASPVNLAIASRLASAPTALQSAGLGVLSGAMQPVMGDDFANEKIKQSIYGGVIGGAGGAAINAASRALSPKMSDAQRLLSDAGVELTPGQLAGGMVSRMEEGVQSIPVLGGAVSQAKQRGMEQFNSATLNRVLEPIREKTDKIGREGFAEVKAKIGQAYDDVLSKLAVSQDAQFANDIANLRAAAQNLPDTQAAQFEKLLNNLVLSRFTQAGKMSGEQMKKVESELGRKASNYMRDASADVRDMGAALKEAQNILRETVIRSNPQKAEELKRINEAFSMYARVRRATTTLGAEEGVFTPAQLLNAVKAEDKTVGKAGFGQGKAVLQDLAEAGKTVLGSKVPNSGTPERMATMGLLAGAPVALVSGAGTGTLAPLAAAGLLSSLYTKPGQQIINRAVFANRGGGALRLSDLLQAGAAPAVLGLSGAVQ